MPDHNIKDGLPEDTEKVINILGHELTMMEAIFYRNLLTKIIDEVQESVEVHRYHGFPELQKNLK